MKKFVLGMILATMTLSGCELDPDDEGTKGGKYRKVTKKYPVSSVLEKVSVGEFNQHLYATYEGKKLEYLVVF